MLNPDYFLEQCKISVNKADSVEAQILQMTRGFGVQPSYEGDKPYIFISYAHKDSSLVLPAIRIIQDRGYPVWYDAGIRPGSTWTDDIANHIENAALVISFLSCNAIDSPHCKAEISHAFNNRKPMLSVRLDQVKLPSGMEMQLSQSQMLPAFLENEDSYLLKLTNQPFIEETAGAALRKYNEEKRREAEEIARKKRAAEEAEAAERRRKEAEEAERRRKEAEEAERRRREAEELRRRRKEAEEERRRRREAAQAELKRLDDEEAEAKRQEEEERRKAQSEKKYMEQQAAGKYHDVLQELALEKEARQKAEAEQKRLLEALVDLDKQQNSAEERVADMKRSMEDLEELLGKAQKTEYHLRRTVKEERQRRKDAENERNRLERQISDGSYLSETIGKRAPVYTEIQEALYRKNRSGYNRAITGINDAVNACSEDDLLQKYALEACRVHIKNTVYHDARVFERRRKNRMAYLLYDALPDDYSDAKERKEKLLRAWEVRACIWAVLIALIYLATNFLLIKNCYDREASFWFKALISLGPTVPAAILCLLRGIRWGRAQENYQDGVAYGILVCPAICLVADIFLYPAMPVWLRILTSIGFNAVSALLGIFSGIAYVFFVCDKLDISIEKIENEVYDSAL